MASYCLSHELIWTHGQQHCQHGHHNSVKSYSINIKRLRLKLNLSYVYPSLSLFSFLFIWFTASIVFALWKKVHGGLHLEVAAYSSLPQREAKLQINLFSDIFDRCSANVCSKYVCPAVYMAVA
jgi:hypothetical protein